MTVLCLFFATAFYAQNVNVQGRVTDETGQPVAGATVKVKGQTTGTITNANGQYSLSAPANSTLEISCMGFKAQAVKVGATGGSYSVNLAEDVAGLEEVVVTALGIRKEQKALGYSVASIDADELVKAGAPNFATALYGKAPGVRVSAAPGGNVSAVTLSLSLFSTVFPSTMDRPTTRDIGITNASVLTDSLTSTPRISRTSPS